MSDILRFVPKDLTASQVLADKKCWIATAATLAASIGSSLFGGNQAAKAAKKAKKENTYRSNAEKAWFDKEYNTDYIDTAAGQNLMRRAQEVQNNYVRKADGAAAVGGGTAASTAMAKESANKAMGDTVANIAAQDTARKQHVADTHQANVSQLSRERQEIETNRAANINNAAQNASNALMSAGVNQLGSQLEGGKTVKTNNLDNNIGSRDNGIVTQLGEDGASRLKKAAGTLDNLPNHPNDDFNPSTYGKSNMEEAMRHRLNKGLYK